MSLYIAKVGVEHVAYYTGRKQPAVTAWAGAGVSASSGTGGGVPTSGGGGSAGGGGGSGGAVATSGAAAKAGGAVGYYTGNRGELPGRWLAAGAMGVVEGGVVTPDQLAASLSAVDPSSGEQLGRRYQPGGSFVDKAGVTRRRRMFSAFDLVYAPPKSVSAAWALAGGAERKEIEQAFAVSTEAVVSFLQSEAVASRAGYNGVTRVEVPEGATVAAFDHWTSRAGDPHVHTHLLFHNRVRCEDGKWRTLDGRLIYRHAAAAAMVGAAVLRAELSQRLGWSWDRVGDNWHAELAGRPDDLTAEWSSRHRDIAKAAQAKIRVFEAEYLREPTPDERLAIWQDANRQTRQDKGHDSDPHARWREEARELGVEPETLLADLRSAQRRETGPYDRAEVLVAAHDQQLPDTLAAGVVAQLEQLAAASRGLTRPDILRTVWATLNASAELSGSDIDIQATLTRLADDLWERVCDQLVERDGRWYSPGLAAAEVTSVSWLGGEAEPDRSEADTEGLGADQTAAVAAILGADTNGVLVIGPAGAGKTKMLGRVAGAVGAERVLAVAPTAAAAANLGEALDVAAETAALAAITEDRVPQGGWVIVDEAGQLDTRTLAALAGRAARARARMVLVGDTAQQGSVGAGGVFEALADRPDLVPATLLSELWRFGDRDEARATIGLRVGDKAALDYHTERGRVHDTTEPELADFAAAWWEQRRDQNTIITAPTLSLVTEINTEIAARRHRSGETGDIVSGAGGDAIRVGDTVATRRNHRKIVASDGQWVRNGDRWVVTGGDKDGAVTAHRLDDETATVVLPGSYVTDHLDLGYATTQARVQSLTVDAALCAVTVASRRAQLYVGLTRGRRANHLVVVTDQPQHDPDTPPDHLPPDHIIEAVLKRGSAHPLSVPAGSQHIPAYVAAAHLGQIADTPYGAPLPDLEALGGRRSLGTVAAVTDSVEARVSSDIEAWLDGQLAEDEAARRWEDTFLASLEAGEDVEELFAPAVADPDDWSPIYDLPPDDYDDYAPERVPATPPASAPVALASDVEGAVAVATEAWGADHFEPFLALADSWADQPGPHPLDDPGPLVDLVARYQLARRVGDRDAASHTVALMAAVADPTLRALLDPHVRRRLSPDETQWAADVRASLRARRAQRWSTTLEALDAARSRLHTQFPEGGPPGADLAAIDRAHWYQAVADWLTDGASAARLSAVWYLATQRTAQVIAATAQPAQAPIPVPWTQPTNPPAAAGPRLPAMRPIPLPNRTQPAPAEDSSQTPQRQVLERSADWYHQQLLRSPHATEARQYLTDRGITPHDWKKWKLGWAPDRWRGLCNTIREDKVAVDSGVAAVSRKTGRAYDVLRARIVFPIRTRGGDVIGFAGRKLPTNTDPRSPKYLNTRTTHLYHKTETLYGIAEAAEGIRATGTAGVVEGYTDAIAAHKAGLTNVVATGGTAFTQSHLTRIVAVGAHHLVAAFDGDSSGQQAQRKVLDQAHEADIPTTAVTFPPGEDPASLGAAALLEHWHTGLPQPWPHINQHLGGTDIHTRIRGHRAVADTYTDGDPVIAAIATHQALTHTLGATPHTLAAWHRPGTRAAATLGGSARTGPPRAGVSTVGGF
ncbi:MobF family relaxase [Candidatus Spongiisocius sp.]|uniref:MobF family relaxase n=1 Tax=Candidatus Spongiisocius sp. TaxID=3101273 RepID=UPI003B5BE96C